MRWLDEQVQRLCTWLNDLLSGRHQLATLGYQLAGVDPTPQFPVDRRAPDHIVAMAHTNAAEKAVPGAAGGNQGWFTQTNTSCGYWAYCHIKGYPCVKLGVGTNSVEAGENAPNPMYGDLQRAGSDLCPNGSTTGTAWYGCCFKPGTQGSTAGVQQARLIAFLDCCQENHPTRWGIPCVNWWGAKNWCFFNNEERTYYCTVVVDMGDDSSLGCNQ
jgi:hypothetical protein